MKGENETNLSKMLADREKAEEAAGHPTRMGRGGRKAALRNSFISGPRKGRKGPPMPWGDQKENCGIVTCCKFARKGYNQGNEIYVGKRTRDEEISTETGFSIKTG